MTRISSCCLCRWSALLFDYEKEVSAIELSLVPGADINSVKSRIKSLLGDDFSVKDRYEQQEASFRMMQGEKWMIFSDPVFHSDPGSV